MRGSLIFLCFCVTFVATNYKVFVVNDQSDIYDYMNQEASGSGSGSADYYYDYDYGSGSGSGSGSSDYYESGSGGTSESESNGSGSESAPQKSEESSGAGGSGSDYEYADEQGSDPNEGSANSNETDINDEGGVEVIIIVPEEQTDSTDSFEEIETGAPEQSTEAPRKGTTYDFENIKTGVPEASTNPPKNPVENEPNPIELLPVDGKTGATDGVFIATDAAYYSTSDDGMGCSENCLKRTTTTPTQSTSSGVQLSRWLEDLNMRRNQTATTEVCDQYYQSRVADQLVSTDSVSTTDSLTAALNNITLSQQYINTLISSASTTVQTAYSEICNMTSKQSFYEQPKRTRYNQVNNVIQNLSGAAQSELNEINLKAKAYCRASSVDTPPYTLGNISGLKLGNGAILTK